MHKIFAAVRTNSEFLMALKSSVDTIFLLNSEILTLKEVIDKAHKAKKKIFIYLLFISEIFYKINIVLKQSLNLK